MRKFLTIVSIFILSAPWVNAQMLSIASNIPQKAVAGHKFRVVLTVQKEYVNGFAKYEQKLPLGFTALEDSGQNAEFHFDNQVLTLVWLRLPASGFFKTSFTIQVADTLKGLFKMSGKFSYLYKNNFATADVMGNKIKIITLNEYMAQVGQQVDLENLVFVPEAKVAPMVRIKRLKKDTANKLMVAIKINSSDTLNTVHFAEHVSETCNIEVLDSANAQIVVKNNTLMADWAHLPAGESTLKYRLVPKTKNTVVLSDFRGALSYFAPQGKQIFEVFDPDNSFYVLQDNAAKNVIPDEMIASKEKSSTHKTTKKNINKSLVASASNTALAGKLVKTLKLGSNVHYRVQIAALSKSVPESYFKRYGIKQSINKEQHSGMYKYTIGDFKTYAEAQEFKNKLIKTTKVKNAFITAYKKDNRITVQKALRKKGK